MGGGQTETEGGPMRLLTIRAVAERLGVSAGTVRAWTRRELLPSVTLGTRTRRWRESDVEWLIIQGTSGFYSPLTHNGGFKGRRRGRRRAVAWDRADEGDDLPGGDDDRPDEGAQGDDDRAASDPWG